VSSSVITDETTARSARATAMARPRIARSVVGPLLALVAMVVVFTALNENFLTVVNGLNIMRQSAVLLVIALAGTFIILMGSVDLSVGSLTTLVAIVGAIIFRDSGSAWLLLLIPLMGIAAGAINGVLFAYARLPSFLVTLGTLFAFDGLALYISGGLPIALRAPEGLNEFFIGDYLWRIPNSALWALVVFALCVLLARKTRFGRYVYAIGGGEKVATLSGVPVRRYKLYAFMLSGLLVSIGGLMLMFRVQSGAAEVGEPFLLLSIAAIVMGGTPLTGGVGGPHRTLLGVLLISVLTNGMSVANVHPFLQIVVQGLVVIIAVALTIDRRKLTLVK
jgi:ribose/xylose/arabinose/galactoside ABC-type transport system permease subunit